MNLRKRRISKLITTGILYTLLLSCTPKKEADNTNALMDETLTLEEIVQLDKKDCDKFNGLIYNENQMIINSKNDTIALSSILEESNKPTLIIRLSSYSCASCIEYLLSSINPLIQNIDIENRLIIMANVFVGDLHVIQNDHKSFRIYKSDSLITDFDMALTPYLFILDKNKTVQDFYIPRKENPDGMNAYLNFIKNKYIKDTDNIDL